MLKQYWNNIPSFVKNKYFFTSLVFFVWMLFFDQNDIISQIQLQAELYQLQEDKEYYQEEITSTNKDLDELLTNDENLEKFAREKYLMKKDNEEVFVIVKE